MACIKSRITGYAARASLTAAMLLLCACGTVSKKDNIDETDVQAKADEAPLVVIANPYLQQKALTDAAVQIQFVQAQNAMQKQDWKTAKSKLQGLIQQHPKLSGPYVNLGITYWRQDKLEQAEQQLIKATEVNPLNNDAYNQLGLLLREQGRFADALKWYTKALEVWPHAPESLRNVGILYDLYMGQFEQALHHYELALKVLPEPNRELQGWIIDLKRRMSEEAKK